MANNSVTFRDVYGVIPTFDGKNIQVDQFIRACKKASKVLSANDQARFLDMLQFKLTGSAADLVETKTYADLETLLKDLKNAFDKPVELSDLELELKAIVQNYNESVTDFATRTRKISKKITDRLTEVYNTEDQQQYLTNRITEVRNSVIRAFTRGLFDKISNQLMHKEINTFDNAVIEATNIENELERRQTVHQGRIREKSDKESALESVKVHFAQTNQQPNKNKYCEIHKSNTHSTAECSMVQRLRENQSPKFGNFENRDTSRERYFRDKNNSQNYGNNFQNNSRNYSNNSQNYQNNPRNYSNNSQNYQNNPRNYSNNSQNYQQNQRNYSNNSQNNFQNNSRNYQNNSQNYPNNSRNYQNNSRNYPNNSQNYQNNQRNYSNNQRNYQNNSQHSQNNSQGYSNYSQDSQNHQNNWQHNPNNSQNYRNNSRNNSRDRNYSSGSQGNQGNSYTNYQNTQNNSGERNPSNPNNSQNTNQPQPGTSGITPKQIEEALQLLREKNERAASRDSATRSKSQERTVQTN